MLPAVLPAVLPARAPGGASGGASGAWYRWVLPGVPPAVLPAVLPAGSGGELFRPLYLGMVARLHIWELLRGTLPGVPKVALGAIQARCRILMAALTIAERGHGARVSGRKAGLLFGGAALA